MKILRQGSRVLTIAVLGLAVYASQARADNVDFKSLLQQGLLGAGVGAISSGTSGGNAGTGALVGAGSNIIGGSLLSFLSSPSSGSVQQVAYAQPYYAAPQPVVQQPVYYADPQPQYAPAYAASTYYAQPQDDPSKKIIKQGLLGAGVGALSAGTSGGNAGTGALVGAGTNVIGGALVDFLSTPSAQPQPAYAYPAQTAYSVPSQTTTQSNPGLHKHIIRKFDSAGKVISEEEIWE